MCVFNVGRTTNQELYLKYMLKFHDWCRDLDFTEKCSDNILSLEMKNDMDEIQKCVKNSFLGNYLFYMSSIVPGFKALPPCDRSFITENQRSDVLSYMQIIESTG